MTEPTERANMGLCCGGKVFDKNCGYCWGIFGGDLVKSLENFEDSCECKLGSGLRCSNCQEAKRLIKEYRGNDE
jgi:hypothetical protein